VCTCLLIEHCGFREWRNDVADLALNVLGVIFQVDVRSYRGETVTTYRWSDLSTSDPKRDRTPVLSMVYSGSHYQSTVLTQTPQTLDPLLDAESKQLFAIPDPVSSSSATPSSAVHIIGDEVFSRGHTFRDWDNVVQTAEMYCKTRGFLIVKKEQTDKKGRVK
jgi:hypothetical protein